MTCRELKEHLAELVSGDLMEDVRAELERHMRDCPGCVAYFQTYQLTIHLTRRLPNQPVPDQVMIRLKAAVTRVWHERPAEDA